MKRRRFLKYTGLGTTGLILAACADNWFTSNHPSPKTPPIFGKLEKTYVTVGYLPTNNAAPLIMAQEQGFFQRYGLTVGFSRQNSQNDLEKALEDGKLDAAIASYPLALVSHISEKKKPIVSLMNVSINGSAITLAAKMWAAGIRPVRDYINFREFAAGYRHYLRKYPQQNQIAIASKHSLDYYLCRYWLAAMGVNPMQEIEFTEIEAGQMIYKLQAGIIGGYCVEEPYNQEAIWEKAGFTVDLTRNIWQGHPHTILAASQTWVEENPITARTLVAAILEGCKYCDQLENRPEIAQIIAQNQYLNRSLLTVEPGLLGNYNYEQLDNVERTENLADFNLFHFQKTDYLEKPNHVNYPWRSHGVWLLTQMVRWHDENLSQYPQDGDEILAKAYPVEIYEEVAKALELEIPQETMKKEPSTVFIDQREFDPSEPLVYLNQFELRAKRELRYFTG